MLLFFYRQLVREARRNEHRVALPAISRRLVDRALAEDGVLEVPLLKTAAPLPAPAPSPLPAPAPFDFPPANSLSAIPAMAHKV